jgi:hypothetical protein
MLPSGLIVPSLQRIDEVLEDLDSVRWELDQIAGHPELPGHLVPEAERKIAQAKNVLSQVLPLVREITVPFTEEQATLKAAQEAVLQASQEACVEGIGQRKHCLLNK